MDGSNTDGSEMGGSASSGCTHYSRHFHPWRERPEFNFETRVQKWSAARPWRAQNRPEVRQYLGPLFAEALANLMIFFFEQGGRYVRCELLPLPDGGSELIVTAPEGNQTVEILHGSAQVTRRVTELQESLLSAGWWGPVGREI
jgi:hypothetical protein